MKQKGSKRFMSDKNSSENYSLEPKKISKPHKGGNTMINYINKITRSLLIVGTLAIALILGVGKKAEAINLSTNNTVGMTITFDPITDIGLEISSGGAITFGTISASTWSVNPATITFVGNVNGQEITMSATCTASSGGSLVFDDSPESVANDQIGVWAVFSGTHISSAPSQNEFQISAATVTQSMGNGTVVDVGDGTTQRMAGPWNQGGAGDGGSSMNSINANVKRHLWVYLRPASTFTQVFAGSQSLVFTLNSEIAD